MLVFPFHETVRALFESVMAVTVAAVAVLFSWLYFKKLPVVETKDGIMLGVVWWIVCVAIDPHLVMAGPMEMSLSKYFADIGLTYVSISVITTGMAKAFGWSPGVA